MKVKANKDISPYPHQQVFTMDSNLRDFSRINPPIFYGYKIYEYPYEFILEFYKTLYAIRVSSSEKAELPTYKLKDVAQTLYVK